MKKLLTVSLVLIAGMCLADEPAKAPALSKEERARINASALGGFVFRPLEEGAKQIVVLDGRTAGTNDFISAFEKRLVRYRLPYKVVKGSAASYDNANGDIVISIVEEGDLCIYPEKKMAVVPVAKGQAGLVKALVCVLSMDDKPVTDMQAMKAIMVAAKNNDIKPLHRAPYVAAVEQGWAPPPTNDIQKAIWDRVMAEKAKATATNAPSATPPAK